MKRIELPTEELAEELHRHLQGVKLPGSAHERTRNAIQLPGEMSETEWSDLKGEVEGWAAGRHMEVVESLRLQARKPEPAKEKPKGPVAREKKELRKLTPEQAEERYNYLQAKPFSELTDEEYEERLALAETLSEKPRPQKK